MRTIALLLCALISASPARAYDPNTADSIVIIEADEVGFIVFGKRKPRQVGPGWHRKLAFLERVGVITTTPIRSETVSVEARLRGGEVCTIEAYLEYNIADARKAFDWRKAQGLDTHQQRELFKEARSDYAEPSRVLEAAITTALAQTTRRQAACGAVEAWLQADALALQDTINADGTQILTAEPSYTCANDLRATMVEAAQSCRLSPPLSKSFSSSAPGNPHHRSPHQNQL